MVFTFTREVIYPSQVAQAHATTGIRVLLQAMVVSQVRLLKDIQVI
jgi:hypothetical protein